MAKKSKRFRLNLSDAAKGFIIAMLTAMFTCVYAIIESGGLKFDKADWQLIATTTVLAALSYISKNFLTNSNDEILKGDKANDNSEK